MKRTTRSLNAIVRLGALSLMLGAVSGCAGDNAELNGWMDQQRREVKPTVEPLTAPRNFVPQGYNGRDSVEPFSLQKLSVALKQEARQPNSLLASEMNRRREPLEAYPLDSLTMVGSVNKQGSLLALMKADDLLYQVKLGEHAGQNYGKVTKITETEVQLREIVQDAAGEWIERMSSLQLQEQAK